MKRRRWLTAYAPLFIWVVVILGLGSGMGAVNETSRIIRPLLEFLFPDALPETLAVYHGYIRKFAHFAEYAVLGILAVRAFSTADAAIRAVIFSTALCLAVALADETIQSFNPARTGSVIDVMIDLSGAAGGIAIATTFLRRRLQRDLPADQ